MSKFEETVEKALESVVFRIVSLESRCDAQSLLLRILVKQAGGDDQAVGGFLERVAGAATQKRLEQIEGLSPSLASRVDTRQAVPVVDQEILKLLKFRS